MSHFSLGKFWIVLYINIHILILSYEDYISNDSIKICLGFFWQYLQNNRLVKIGGSGFHGVCLCFVFQTLLPGPCPCPNGELLRKGRKIGALVKGSSAADIPQTTQPCSGKHCCANCHHQGLIMRLQTEAVELGRQRAKSRSSKAPNTVPGTGWVVNSCWIHCLSGQIPSPHTSYLTIPCAFQPTF